MGAQEGVRQGSLPPFLRDESLEGHTSLPKLGMSALSGRGGPGAREHRALRPGFLLWTAGSSLFPSCLHPVTWGGTLLMPLFSTLRKDEPWHPMGRGPGPAARGWPPSTNRLHAGGSWPCHPPAEASPQGRVPQAALLLCPCGRGTCYGQGDRASEWGGQTPDRHGQTVSLTCSVAQR